MRIGQVARATGTTTRALRYYEQKGLLTANRTTAGYREYGDEAVTRVRNIRELQSVGFTIDDIRLFTGLLDRPVPTTFTVVNTEVCGTAMHIAQRRLRAMGERIERLAALYDELARRLDVPPLSVGTD
ncbi:MerR family transcriptional regulator [Nocardia camponoti]|uniref:MerR family transcriptional regulator n=1 Tax=Nocardia camponoti TaxID=1616106 RepID=A0A917V3Q9_9NOCA|nr:MerR family transcriptional regulator [Nocardia camponoti]GGK32660.1 MerR family transcriptional regulator [Nocardia camponoti]